jgi:hypothetical protein
MTMTAAHNMRLKNVCEALRLQGQSDPNTEGDQASDLACTLEDLAEDDRLYVEYAEVNFNDATRDRVTLHISVMGLER